MLNNIDLGKLVVEVGIVSGNRESSSRGATIIKDSNPKEIVYERG